MKRVYLLFLFLVLVSSCSHYKWAIDNRTKVCDFLYCSKTDSIRRLATIVKDTINVIQKKEVNDSLYLDYYLACDSNNNVILKKLVKAKSEKDSVKSELINNILKVKAYYQDSIEFYKKLIKETTTKTDTIYQTKKEYFPVKEPFIPWYAWVLVGVGLLLAFIAGAKIL